MSRLVMRQEDGENFDVKFKRRFGMTFCDWLQQDHIKTYGQSEQITWTDGYVSVGHTCYDTRIQVYIDEEPIEQYNNPDQLTFDFDVTI